MISVVVAVRDEPPPSGALLARLSPARERDGGEKAEEVEVLVAAAAGTSGETLSSWRAAGARLLVSEAPRGERLRAAASEARGDVLLFLHADTLLPDRWSEAVRRGLAKGAVGGAFRLAFDGAGPASARALRLVALAAALRTSLTSVPYGDQAPFVRREAYVGIGGHAPWPLLEDVDLFRRLRKAGPIALLPERAVTSARRYARLGVARTVLRNWRILVSWHLGARPERLALLYRRAEPSRRFPAGGTA